MIIFESLLTTFNVSVIYKAAGLVSKIGSSLTTLSKYNQVKLVQIHETLCSIKTSSFNINLFNTLGSCVYSG